MIFLLAISLSLLFSNDCERISVYPLNFPYSFYIYDLTSGREVAKCKEDLLLIPASSLKLLTSIYSFERMGREFRFKTEIGISGKGNKNAKVLIIKGGGDFTLGSENFSSSYQDVAEVIFNAVERSGIKKIDNLVIENKYFRFPDGSVEWQDLGNYYATSVSFFSINDNSYKVYLRSFEEGKKAEVLRIVPDIGLKFSGDIYASSPTSGDNAYIYSTPYSNSAFLSGTIPALKEEFVIKGAIFRPDIFFANYLCIFLKERGISIGDCSVSEGINVEDYSVIETIYSPKISEIIRVMNRKSFNLYADSLMHFALIKEGKIGFHFVKEDLYRFLSSLHIKDFRIVDGSGLSRRNYFTSKGFVNLLHHAYRSEYFREFYSSLDDQQDYESKYRRSFRVYGADEIRVKTGSMSGVRSWSGYVKKGGRIYAFSFIFNNYLGSPSLIENLCKEYLSKALD